MASAAIVTWRGQRATAFFRRAGSAGTLAAATAAGATAFLYPLLLSHSPSDGENAAHAGDAPLVFALLAALAAALFLFELASGGMNAKVASALAVIATAAALLRLPPLPAGASAFFFLIILAGYVFGPRFGFLAGALGLLMSAFASGGFGPWVPFQMFAAGWLGMTSGWLGGMRRGIARRPAAEIALLVAFGIAWGFLYGALLNLWFWPYIATGENVSWEPGLGFGETLRRYWSFYALTSAAWDAWAAAGNAILLVVAGRPLLSMLTRYRDRFQIRFGD